MFFSFSFLETQQGHGSGVAAAAAIKVPEVWMFPRNAGGTDNTNTERQTLQIIKGLSVCEVGTFCILILLIPPNF